MMFDAPLKKLRDWIPVPCFLRELGQIHASLFVSRKVELRNSNYALSSARTR
jgi:hypothetical protein